MFWILYFKERAISVTSGYVPLAKRRTLLCLLLIVIQMGVMLTGCSFVDRVLYAEEEIIHADFLVSYDLLLFLIQDLPEPVRERVIRLPEYFLELLFATLHELPPDLMQLIDKDHAVSSSYVPDNLIALDQYSNFLTLNKANMRINWHIAPDLLAMITAAQRENIVLPISSAYRSYDYQTLLFQRSVDRDGLETAQKYVARAGYSQHHLGTTLDFGTVRDEFINTPTGQWLFKHAWEYGFSLSYPEGQQSLTGYNFESWHYRYIGRSATKLERYFFTNSQQTLLSFFNSNRSVIESLLIPIESAFR